MFLAFKVLISFLGATAVNANLAEPAIARAHLQNKGPSTGQTKACLLLLATMLVTV